MLDDVYEVHDDGSIVVSVHAQPGAGRSAIVGKHGNRLKVRVAAPPVEGRANEALTKLLGDLLGGPEGTTELVSGEHSREKRFKVTGVEVDEFARRLEAAVEAGNAAPGRGVRDRRPPARP